MSLDAMKLALEALEHVHRTGDTQVFDLCYADQVIPSLRAAIEEAEKTRQWQGLTDDDIAQAMYIADAIITGPMQFKFAREIEAKLKEKNNG